MKLRIRFSKLGKIRWTSHRDVARMWERAFRRVQLPLAYSEGFSPRPKVSFGLALPTGHESVAEFLDVELSAAEGIDLATLPLRLSAALPVGVDANVVSVLETGTPSLQADVTSCSWRWMAAAVDGAGAIGPNDLGQRVAAALAAPALTITRTRKGRQVSEDIRPGIAELHVCGEDAEGVWLEADLAAQPVAVRPSDVLTALGHDLEERHVRRTHQWILRHGARLEPLSLPQGDDDVSGDVTKAPHALERAS